MKSCPLFVLIWTLGVPVCSVPARHWRKVTDISLNTCSQVPKASEHDGSCQIAQHSETETGGSLQVKSEASLSYAVSSELAWTTQ